MKKYTIIVFLILCTTLQAQKYLRYDMEDGSFNGFYTERVDSILHDVEDGIMKSFVYSNDVRHVIPVDDIKGIGIENVVPSKEDYGKYRLYEINSEDLGVKKIFVDNRASLIASTNGEFGANDTILFSSAYNDAALLMTTDSIGRIKKIFDQNILLFFDYDAELGNEAIIITEGRHEVIPIEYSEPTVSKTRIAGASALTKVADFIRKNKLLSELFVRERGNIPDFLESAISNDIDQFLEYLMVLSEVESNPEMRNQCLIVDALTIAGDLAAIVTSIAAIPVSGGASTVSLAIASYDLIKNLETIRDRLFPDEEQMRVYHDYYKNKYGLSIETLPATDVTKTSATLNGSITSQKLLAGNLYFSVENRSKTYPANRAPVSDGLWNLSAELKDLESGKKYSFEAGYAIKVDGLDLVFTGGKQSFVSKSDIPNITGVWLCKDYQDGKLVGEATFELKEDKTVIKYDESGSGAEPGINTGYWSINDEGTFSVEFSKSTFSGAHWKSYGGTFDNLSSPTKIEGKAFYQYTGNMGLGTQRFYDFTMTR